MQAPTGPSRSSSFAGDAGTGTSPRTAALLGATTAFGRPTPRGKPSDGGQKRGNDRGDLAGASDAGVGSRTANPVQRTSRPPSLLRQDTNESVRSVKSNAGSYAPSLGSSPTAHLGVPQQQPDRAQTRSPSLQAAAIAAARAPRTNTLPASTNTARSPTSNVRRPAAPPKPRRLSEYKGQADSEGSDEPTDATSIPPTTSLVDMFERKASVSGPAKRRPGPIVVKPGDDLALKSPKPVRTSGGITSMFQMELENGQRLPQQAAGSAGQRHLEQSQLSRVLSSKGSYASASEGQPEARPASVVDRRAPPPPAGFSNKPSTSTQTATSEARPIPIRPSENALVRSQTFTPSSASAKSIPAQFHHMYPPRRMTPNMTGDQLANAMVAGSLASSRAPSPRKMDAPPPPTRRQKHKSTLGFSRTPSPTKTGMRHTLRKEESESSDESDDDSLHPYGKHKKKRHIRKHPNKHHEGDRKRWRDAVTEAERKRYEGLWAANKGLHIGFLAHEIEAFKLDPDSQETKDIRLASRDEVSNIVVHELWDRSRLPPQVLSDIWNLVDNRGVGRLTKEEFVVGVWLIDQRLKGRKLPPRVTDTVWASVRGLQGIKIKK